MATREVKMLQQMLDPNQPDPTQAQIEEIGEEEVPNPSAAGDSSITNEIELTDEMRDEMPVVNTAREQNRMSGISNFLANPEVQNALLQFGRAFSGNREGEPGTVLANAGEGIIQSNADQAALEAFERGEDPAEAAGRFANPELVRSLQDRQQQEEQFDEEMELQRSRLNLEETKIENDTVYRTAKLALDRDLAEARIQNLERQVEIDQQIADARQAYWESLDAQESDENLTLRTNEYLQVLNEQNDVIDDSIQNTVDALDDLDVDISDQELSQLKNGVITVNDLDISSADDSSIPFYAGEGEELANNLLGELSTQIKAAQTSQAQTNALKQTQTERLTGEGEEDIDQRREDQLFGGRENPIPVTSPSEMSDQDPGTYVNYGGVIYEILPGNRKREVSQ